MYKGTYPKVVVPPAGGQGDVVRVSFEKPFRYTEKRKIGRLEGPTSNDGTVDAYSCQILESGTLHGRPTRGRWYVVAIESFAKRAPPRRQKPSPPPRVPHTHGPWLNESTDEASSEVYLNQGAHPIELTSFSSVPLQQLPPPTQPPPPIAYDSGYRARQVEHRPFDLYRILPDILNLIFTILFTSKFHLSGANSPGFQSD